MNLSAPSLVRRVERALVRSLPTAFLTRSYIYLSSRVFCGLSHNIIRAQSPLFGVVKMAKHDYVGRHLYFYGIWEPAITAFIQDNIAEGDTFIDIGANIGYYSLVVGRLVGPQGKVISVEPSPSIFKLLTENVSLNQLNNTSLFNIGVDAQPRVADFFLFRSINSGRSGFDMHGIGGYKFEAKIAVKPLADIVALADLQQTKIIKFDVEGSEVGVLQSILDVVPSLRDDCILLGEISLDTAQGSAGVRVREILAEMYSMGFAGVYIPNEYSHKFYLSDDYPRPRTLTMTEGGVIDVALSRCPMVIRPSNRSRIANRDSQSRRAAI